MFKINLSQEERNIIYEEELKKRQKEKLDNISEEERQEIFEEENKIKIVEVDSSMIALSINKRHKIKLGIIEFIIFAIVSFYSFIWAIIIGIIVYAVVGLMIRNLDNDMIHWKCPYCGADAISIPMTDDSKVDNNNFRHNHYIYTKSNVKSDLSCNKCHRKYEFRYTYLNKDT